MLVTWFCPAGHGFIGPDLQRLVKRLSRPLWPRTRRDRCIGVNIAAIYRLETLAALVLNDHAYDKLAAWSNVIPVVSVKGDATEN